MINKLLENGKYEDALKLLKSPKTENEYYQKIICLYSLEKYHEAKIECELALDMAEKQYYDIVSIYVSTLMALEEDDLAIKVLEDELEMPYIPYKYEVQFNASYDELLKKRMANNKVHSAYDLLSDDELKNALLNFEDNNEFIILLSQLETRNIRRFLDILEDYLVSDKIKQNAKTVILELLKSQDVSKVIKVKNKDKIIDINLNDLPNVLEQEEIGLILNKISDVENPDDPNYLVYSQDVLFSYVGSLYPTLLNKDDVNNIACAISLYVDSLFNNEEGDFEKKVVKYDSQLEKVNEIFDEISESMLY